jgi:2'-5' RNA ligase
LRGARFAREFHVTLKFLGEIVEARHAAISDALESAFLPARRFSVSAGPLAAFPTARRASVLYGGIDAGLSALEECARLTEEALAEVGFPRESHDFVPHVTLCRFRRAARLNTWIVSENERIDAADVGAYPSFEATAFALVRSELRPEGALYTPLVSYPLS